MFSKVAMMVLFLSVLAPAANAGDIKASKVAVDLSLSAKDEAVWKNVQEETVSLMAQPMAVPRPKETNTSVIRVQALHDGKSIAFRLRWADPEKSEAGILGKYSDAVALQFPVKEEPLPPVFMGAKDQPVHIFHWRAQYQRDKEKGKPQMKDLYPNMNPDMYPMEFRDPGKVVGLTDEMREVYVHGKAAGNPQSHQKLSAVDEIFAEGFGSSSVIENNMSSGFGEWKNGEWIVTIVRPLKREKGSVLEPGKSHFVAFAAWQGGRDEVGSRKCVTMSWVPLQIVAQPITKGELL